MWYKLVASYKIVLNKIGNKYIYSSKFYRSRSCSVSSRSSSESDTTLKERNITELFYSERNRPTDQSKDNMNERGMNDEFTVWELSLGNVIDNRHYHKLKFRIYIETGRELFNISILLNASFNKLRSLSRVIHYDKTRRAFQNTRKI